MTDPEHMSTAAELLESIALASVTLDGMKNHEAKKPLRDAIGHAVELLAPPKTQAKPATVTTLGRPL